MSLRVPSPIPRPGPVTGGTPSHPAPPGGPLPPAPPGLPGATRAVPRGNRPPAGADTFWRDERGFVGGFEALPFGFLVFVIGVALLVNAWGVIDAKLAASAAAREAARAFVESDGPAASNAVAEARQAAADAIDGHKVDPGTWAIRTQGPTELRRCARVTFVVSYDVPTFRLPWIGGFGGSVITATGRHSEVVDPYRDGLAVPVDPVPDCRG